MKFVQKLFVFVAVALVFGPALANAAEDPKEILKKTAKRDHKDAVLTIHMVKVSKKGRERPMDLVVKMKDDGVVSKTYAEFLAPPEVKGMKSLGWDYADPGKDAERWFQLAGMDYVKCRGKACASMEDRFGFNMEVFDADVDDADHQLLGEETIDGAACYKIESVRKDQDASDDVKMIFWVDKEKFAARKVEAYDKAGKMTMSSTFTEFKMIGDHWWESKGEAKNVKKGKKIRFEIKEAVVDQGIPDEVFAKPEKFTLKKDEP